MSKASLHSHNPPPSNYIVLNSLFSLAQVYQELLQTTCQRHLAPLHAHTHIILTHTQAQSKLTRLLQRSPKYTKNTTSDTPLSHINTYVGPISSPVISSSMMLESSFFSSCLSRILRMLTLRGRE